MTLDRRKLRRPKPWQAYGAQLAATVSEVKSSCNTRLAKARQALILGSGLGTRLGLLLRFAGQRAGGSQKSHHPNTNGEENGAHDVS